MKNVDSNLIHGSIKRFSQGWTSKVGCSLLGAALIMVPQALRADSAPVTQFQFLQTIVQLSGASSQFNSSSTAVDYVHWAQSKGINPAGGCLPMLIQFPIFVGFYNLLSHAIELRGAPFILWIHDLSAKDPTYVLPILMTVAMFVQQFITPTTADPAQRRMFLIMPIVFGWIFKEFPSGLVLYWLVQNILTIVQQMIMNRYWKDHPAELQTA